MKKFTVRSQWAMMAVAGAFVTGGTLGAQAQQGGGNGGNNRPDWQNMTPEQRQQMQAQGEQRRNEQRQAWLRQAMTGSGLTDVAAQTAVIEHMTAREKSQEALRAQALALSKLLTTPGTADAELQTQLTAYRAAVAAANKQQADDLNALDAQLKYSTQPRVETLLTLLGVLGEETTSLGGIGAIFTESPYANRGGGGGGQNGGRGGQNGGRGGQNGGRGGQNGGRGGNGNGAAQ
ncbi:MAG TPA: hypothetical protein VF719_05270 [Abditibacteriaceae bacterium]